jgi:hypothetical protein
MFRKLSVLVSYLLHPRLVPVYVFLLLLGSDRMYTLSLSGQLKLLLLGTVIVTTLIFPLLLIFLLLRLRLISSVYLPGKDERNFPLGILAVFYYVTYYLLRNFTLPAFFHIFLLGATLTAIGCLIINLFFRISLHTAAWGSVSGICLGILFFSGKPGLIPLISAIILSGIAGTARMKLNAHLPTEIYSGWLVGVVTMCFCCFLV